jgi:hypothetical protein
MTYPYLLRGVYFVTLVILASSRNIDWLIIRPSYWPSIIYKTLVDCLHGWVRWDKVVHFVTSPVLVQRAFRLMFDALERCDAHCWSEWTDKRIRVEISVVAVSFQIVPAVCYWSNLCHCSNWFWLAATLRMYSLDFIWVKFTGDRVFEFKSAGS